MKAFTGGRTVARHGLPTEVSRACQTRRRVPTNTTRPRPTRRWPGWPAPRRSAFARLYRRWAEPVYRYCYRRLLSREAAEDVTSQVMTQALASIGRFHGDSFPAWLFMIAHNAVVSTVRRPSYRLTAPLADDLPVADPSPGPEQLALAGEASRRLYAALAVVTPEQRQVIELRLADLTTAEIVQVIGRTTDAVRMLQHRAIRRLRLELAPPTDHVTRPDPKESSRV